MSERCPSCYSAEFWIERDQERECMHCGRLWSPDQADLADQLAGAMNGCNCPSHRQARKEELGQALEVTGLELIKSGRGYGKTKAAAESIARYAERNPHARIALVATTAREARRLALAVMAASKNATYRTNYAAIEWSNGAIAWLYSEQAPEQLHGAEHSFAWTHRVRHECLKMLATTLRLEPGLILHTLDEDQLEY